jgi:predicted nucleotidyltransferase
MIKDPWSLLTPNDQEAVEEYIQLIRSRYPERILAVALFGSKARGDADDESDIDLLVLVDVEEKRFRDELWHIASRVSLEHNVVVSPSVFGQERWAETRRIRMPIYRAIQAEAVPLTPEPVPL